MEESCAPGKITLDTVIRWDVSMLSERTIGGGCGMMDNAESKPT
jgi:hypothetical protein